MLLLPNILCMARKALGCHILQHFNFSLLPKHFLVQFDERIPKMPKKFNLVDVCPWKIIVLGAYTANVFTVESTVISQCQLVHSITAVISTTKFSTAKCSKISTY